MWSFCDELGTGNPISHDGFPEQTNEVDGGLTVMVICKPNFYSSPNALFFADWILNLFSPDSCLSWKIKNYSYGAFQKIFYNIL